ncbi:MAG: exodeoxyribonuclease VII large subunit [Muribaculaceae bacterium]|nr:exodeoxyribonuclease VII large subunit [Muribaculaceae bacterium]
MSQQVVTLYGLTRLVADLIVSHEGTQNVWVTAELSDVNRRGHIYMELIEKNAAGQAVAKARAVIWANVAPQIIGKFERGTGQRFESGIKLMVKASVSMHPLYGMSLVITDINPEFTMGDLVRRRREILMKLQAEGILEDNRKLEWRVPSLRIAVVSAPGAAGYGDFVHQLYSAGFRFKTQLFPAVMQGDRTVPTVLEALEAIESELENWDGVVVIRGGGATSDLAAFESYDLAARIACFPLPVIVGIGHERDVTVLDYVANMRVKTPTAAAEWLIQRAGEQLDRLKGMAQRLHITVSDKVAGQREQLSYYQASLPLVATTYLSRKKSQLERAMASVGNLSARRIAPGLQRLDGLAQRLQMLSAGAISRQRAALDSRESLLNALSPQATLKRGYSITVVDGVALKSAKDVRPGMTILTCLKDGEIKSITVE